jgi:Serine carboxypeptidase
MDDTYWVGCIPGAGRRLQEKVVLPGEILLAHDKPESTVPYIAELLDDGIRVLIYNADRDLNVNVQGNEMLLDSMEWSGADGWSHARRSLWMVNERVAGYAKSYGNLDFVIVYNSGHLVPNNVPIPALDLITRFLNEQSYHDVELPYIEPKSRTQTGCTEDKNWPAFHAFLILVVALVCFFCGFLAASFSRRPIKAGYSPIADTSSGAIPAEFR